MVTTVKVFHCADAPNGFDRLVVRITVAAFDPKILLAHLLDYYKHSVGAKSCDLPELERKPLWHLLRPQDVDRC